jgi:UDP-N-acetylenolpyruvoylglucosamine reductase
VLEWAKRKSIQPQKSTGSVFKNISNELKEKLGYPTASIGYIVEHVIDLSGFQVGDAAISKAHHGFIENKGQVVDLSGKIRPDILYVGDGDATKVYLENRIYSYKRNDYLKTKKGDGRKN